MSTPSFRFDDLQGRTVVLTGAARGIGRGLAPGLAAQGLRLILVDKDAEWLGEIVEQLRTQNAAVEGITTDLSDPQQRATLAQRIHKLAPTVDGIIHNAAIDRRMPLDTMSLEFFRHMMATNVEPAVEITRDLLPNLRQSRAGRIILISSITFEVGTGLLSAYVAAKGAIEGLTRSFAHELGPDGITVNCIAPGAIVVEKEQEMYSEELERTLLSWQSVKRRLYPADLLGPICLLLSDAGGGISGQTIAVNGGFLHPIADPKLQRPMITDSDLGEKVWYVCKVGSLSER